MMSQLFAKSMVDQMVFRFLLMPRFTSKDIGGSNHFLFKFAEASALLPR